jgi:hypothetical protein
VRVGSIANQALFERNNNAEFYHVSGEQKVIEKNLQQIVPMIEFSVSISLVE